MTVRVKGKKQFIHALSAALDSPYDTQIELEHNGAFMQIKGTGSIENEIESLEKRLTKVTLATGGKGAKLRILADIHALKRREFKKSSIINRFKKTPAAMWGGK